MVKWKNYCKFTSIYSLSSINVNSIHINTDIFLVFLIRLARSSSQCIFFIKWFYSNRSQGIVENLEYIRPLEVLSNYCFQEKYFSTEKNTKNFATHIQFDTIKVKTKGKKWKKNRKIYVSIHCTLYLTQTCSFPTQYRIHIQRYKRSSQTEIK